MSESTFGISTGEADVQNDEIVIPFKFRGVNNPDIFAEVYNGGREMIEEKTNLFDFLLENGGLLKKALRKSK